MRIETYNEDRNLIKTINRIETYNEDRNLIKTINMVNKYADFEFGIYKFQLFIFIVLVYK